MQRKKPEGLKILSDLSCIDLSIKPIAYKLKNPSVSLHKGAKAVYSIYALRRERWVYTTS